MRELIETIPERPLDPIEAKIEAAIDAGIDPTEAIAALDELSGIDLEPEDLEDTTGEVVFLFCECKCCGHRHRLDASVFPDVEPETTIQIL